MVGVDHKGTGYRNLPNPIADMVKMMECSDGYIKRIEHSRKKVILIKYKELNKFYTFTHLNFPWKRKIATIIISIKDVEYKTLLIVSFWNKKFYEFISVKSGHKPFRLKRFRGKGRSLDMSGHMVDNMTIMVGNMLMALCCVHS